MRKRPNQIVIRLSNENAMGAFRCGFLYHPIHFHKTITPNYALVFIETGHGFYHINQKKIEFRAPCIIQHFPDELHSIEWLEESNTAFLSLPAEVYSIFKKLPLASVLNSHVLPCTSPHLFISEVKNLLKTVPKMSDTELLTVLNHVQHLFSLFLLEALNQEGLFFHRVESFINGKLPGLISINNLLEQFPISRSSFMSKFKAEYNCSPGIYIIKKRLALAANSLLGSDLSIGTIAEQCSYADIYTFTRQFKKFYKCTPSQYRRSSEFPY